MLCQEILKEIDGLKKPQDHKVIDIWLLVLMYMNGDPLRKSVSKIFKKKLIEDCIHNVMLDQCIRGNKELVQVSVTIILHEEIFILYLLFPELLSTYIHSSTFKVFY